METAGSVASGPASTSGPLSVTSQEEGTPEPDPNATYAAVSSQIITNCSVSATILKKGRPALFVSGWFAIMLTAATVVCSMVVVTKCCGYLWLPTISSETRY